MPEYVCIDKKYMETINSLTLECDNAKNSYQVGVAKFNAGEITSGALVELDYLMSKAELALTNFRIENTKIDRAFF